MHVQHDAVDDLAYVSFRAANGTVPLVARTIRVDDDIALDFDVHGRLVGVDVTNASKRLTDMLNSQERSGAI